jgi:RND superfamily putative drug exporter
MVRLFSFLGRFVVRYRWPVVAAWAVAAVCVVVLLPPLSSVPSSAGSEVLPRSAPVEQATRLADRVSASAEANTVLTVVLADRSPVFATGNPAWVGSLEHRLGRVATVRAVREVAVSPEGHAIQLQVDSTVGPNSTSAGSAGTRLVASLRSLLTPPLVPRGIQAALTGPLLVHIEQQRSSTSQNGLIQYLSYGVILVLLLLAYRSPLAPLVTLIPAAVALLVAGGVVAEAYRSGVPVSGATSYILIVLLLGAGTDYGVFFLFRVREEIREGLDPHDAVCEAMSWVGEAIAISALTVVAALATLLLATFGLYHSLGAPLALGMAVMLLAGLTLLPALIAIGGRVLFWPAQLDHHVEPRRRGWFRLASAATSRPWVTLGAGLALFALAGIGLLGTTTTGFAAPSTGPRGSESARANALLHQHFPGSSIVPVVAAVELSRPAWSDPGALASVAGALERSGLVRSELGPLDPNGTALSPSTYASLYRRLGPPRDLTKAKALSSGLGPRTLIAYAASGSYLSPSGRVAVLDVVPRDASTTTPAGLAAVRHIDAVLASAARAVGARASGVTGVAAYAAGVSQASRHDLLEIVPIVAVVIGLLLALVLRSAVAPLYLVASVVVSYLAALGLTATIFVHLGPNSGLNFVLPFLMFVFLMALGSDYNIMIMTRIREEAHEVPICRAVVDAIRRTGSTITSAGTILGGTFMVLALTSGPGGTSEQVHQIGFGIAVGVLLDTFFVRTLIVPAAVVLLGRWNWWPSRLYHEGHEAHRHRPRRRRRQDAEAGVSVLTMLDPPPGPSDAALVAPADGGAPPLRPSS